MSEISINDSPESGFGVGDRVTWTHVRQSGSGFAFSTREGKISEVGKRACRVKTRHGKYEWVAFGELTKYGETTCLACEIQSLQSQLQQAMEELKQEKIWKIEDPRMLREQVRIADVAFQNLFKENKNLQATIAEKDEALMRLEYIDHDYCPDCGYSKDNPDKHTKACCLSKALYSTAGSELLNELKGYKETLEIQREEIEGLRKDKESLIQSIAAYLANPSAHMEAQLRTAIDQAARQQQERKK